MVQILPRPESKAEAFAKMISGALSGGARGAETLQNAFRERGERKALSEEYGDIFGKIHNPDTRKQLLSGEIEKRNQAAKLSGEYEADEESYNKIKDVFGQKFADVWKASPTGARTALTHAALEARARGIDLDQILSMAEMPNQETASAAQPMQLEPEQQAMQELQEIITNQDEGLIPEEKFKRSEKRFETGFKEYKEASTKLQGLTRDKERLDILESLNQSDKLPKNLGRLNVDKEGNLRLPFLGTSEAQRYVKTLNEFSAGAKDTFGSRVTNFDLAQYLKRYPTLLNTKEGRRQLNDQMKLVNRINSVYYKNLKKVYDEAGGARAIDADRAEALAEKMSENKVNELAQKFQEIGQFSSKPNPAEFKDRKIVDEKTGEVFVSNGKEWVPAGQ